VGEWHPSILPTLTNLADLLAVQGRAGEAEPLASRAVGIALKAYGPDHPDVAQALLGAARLQSILGRREAPETARLALSALEQTLGADHPVTRGAAPTLRRIASGDRLMVGRPDPEMEQRLAQIETMASTVREDAIAALRGEGDRDVLISALDDMAAGLGRLDRSWHPLATYAAAVAAVLRGRRVPEIDPPLARHLEAIKAAARS
jgi:hypothetical protein